jgi:hypothetical protein
MSGPSAKSGESAVRPVPHPATTARSRLSLVLSACAVAGWLFFLAAMALTG